MEVKSTLQSFEQLPLRQKARAFINQLFRHPLCVGILTMKLAAELEDTKRKDLLKILTISFGHDIGKFGIKGILKIIFNSEKLSDEEKKIMEIHPTYSRDAFEKIGLSKNAEIVFGHHEKWDGSGYPRGLKGKEIPKLSRMLKLADSFDAIVSWRPYNNILTIDEALAELRAQSGKDFDPDLVEPFCKIVEKNRKLIKLLLLKSSGAKKSNFRKPELCPS